MKYARDIRFWISFFFLLRMYGITLPPLEVGHNIRQTDGLMIARNFYERSPNIFYPMTDVAGEKTGIVGSEFPLLNYLIYLLSLIFGFENWFGRLINLTISSLGIFSFHQLIAKFFRKNIAFDATIILLVSLWFTYSRKTIPDTFAASLCLSSLFFAFQYLERGKWYSLVLYFLLGLLGCLSKISATTILSVLALPVFFAKIDLRRKIFLLLFSAVILACVYWWYFLWVPYLNNTYEFAMFFMGRPIWEGVLQLVGDIPGLLARFYDTPLKYTGFTAFLVGLGSLVWRKRWLPFFVFALPFFAFLLVIVKAGSYFITNEYYVLTAIPAMAFAAAYGIAHIRSRRLAAFALVIIAIEGIGNKAQDFRIRQPYSELRSLETIMDRVSKRGDLIAINGDGSGTPMFFAHRRGWISTNEMLSSLEYRNDLMSKGCKYILILKKKPWSDIELNYKVVYDSGFFKIYSLW